MKILVISDSHGHIANLKHVMGFGKKIGVAAVIHAGDWNTLKAVETVLSFNIPLYAVIGNADIADNIKNKFKEHLEVEIGGRKIGVIHNIKNLKTKNLDIVFTGHYHSKDEKMMGNTKIIRPGGLINGVNFVIYDTVSGTIEFVNE